MKKQSKGFSLDGLSGYWDILTPAEKSKFRSKQIGLMDLRRGEKVLEVGCGTGQFWKEHYELLPDRCHLTLTDFSRGMVSKSRKTLHGFPVNFALADVEHLTFHERTFNHIVCHFMLYHAHSQDMALQEICRVLRSGGGVGFLTTSLSHMKRLWDVGYEIDPAFHYESRMSEPFCEENAYTILARYFSNIDKDAYDDTLHIDNSDVVIEYVRSVLNSTKAPPNDSFYQRYAQYVEREIAEQGYFTVGKRTVSYMCR